jgi:hypothetical protein
LAPDVNSVYTSPVPWYVDAMFAVHADFKSHTGGAMTYGTGAPISISRKQKINTKSSTEAELVGVDDVSTMILWTRLFLNEQGYHISRNVLHQESNWKQMASERERGREGQH